MPLTTAGLTHMVGLTLGEALTAFNNAAAHLGVGNSNAVFSAAHTDLQGASKSRRPMDATFPSRSGLVVTFKSTFGTGDGNHAWDEVGVFNALSTGVMLTRVVQALGTKTAGSTWVLTHTVTYS